MPDRTFSILLITPGMAILLTVILLIAIGLSIGAVKTAKPLLKVLLFGGAACFWAAITTIAAAAVSLGIPHGVSLTP